MAVLESVVSAAVVVVSVVAASLPQLASSSEVARTANRGANCFFMKRSVKDVVKKWVNVKMLRRVVELTKQQTHLDVLQRHRFLTFVLT
jgi:hypothetical protein